MGGIGGWGLRSPRLELGSAEPRPLPAAPGLQTSFLPLSPVQLKKGKALTVPLFAPLHRFVHLGCVAFPLEEAPIGMDPPALQRAGTTSRLSPGPPGR